VARSSAFAKPASWTRRATGGDIRALCDLFGLSVAGAHRYTATVDHPGIAQATNRHGTRDPTPPNAPLRAG